MFYRQPAPQTARPSAVPRPSPRREREIEELRGRILDVAEEILVTEGYPALSMRRIAKAVEYAPSTLYSYYHGKPEILQAVLDRTTRLLMEALDEADRTPGPLTRLRMLGRAYLEFGLRHPRQYEVLFLLRGPTVPTIETPAFAAAVERFERAVSEGVQEGVVRRVQPAEVAQAFWACCHGLLALLLTHGQRHAFGEPALLVEATLTMAVEGLRPQAFGRTAPAREPRRNPAAAAPTRPGETLTNVPSGSLLDRWQAKE
ncbi:MAG: TetR/AcrR family transcriptional regulator [Armatimonadetes bacterium]|nr:TetR/AcrR family transcriptional regulator [Armatimonadota bacterium]